MPQSPSHSLSWVSIKQDDGFSIADYVGTSELYWDSHQEVSDSTVRLLETLKADKEAKDDMGRTPLHLATLARHDSMVWFLVETLKADKEAKDSRMRTPLHLAAWNGNNSMARLLVETLKADKEAKDNIGWTPRRLAAERGHSLTVKLLL
ncbi:ankyrin repeat-containing domain protein [Trichophaea hybrida]|nr:ankyrin repeat-containing domain protein [Trichophaea hybrida]